MLVRALVFRPIRRDPLRSALTLAGVAVGVAVIVAIQLANQSALRAFRESVDAVAGRSNYQIASEAGTLDENLLVRLQPLWLEGVRFAPVIDVDGMFEPRQIPIRLLAVDLLSDLHFRDYRWARIAVSSGPGADHSRYLELLRPDSIIVPAPFAREHHLALGAPFTISVLGNRKTMIVRGILEARGPATAFNGSIAICDMAAAQSQFGLRGRLSRIDLLVPAENEERILEGVRRLLPPGVRLERPSRRNERVERMLRAFRVNLFALGGVALLVGVFLVYNTMLISILRRRRDIGIVKTLGATPSQILAAFLIEGAMFGLAGSAAGILLGRALASVILRVVGRTVNSLYVTSRPDVIVMTPSLLAAAVAIGTLLSLISALQPSLEASRFPAGILIRHGLQQTVHARVRRRWFFYASGCFAAAALTSRLPPVGGIAVAGYVAVLFVVAGFSMLAPAVVRFTTLAFSPLIQRLAGVPGQLAAASLLGTLRRTAIASAALAIATGMMVAVALMVGSFRETVRIWVGQTVRSDLWLRPAKGLSNAQSAFFPASILEALRGFDFIDAVDPVRGHDVLYRDALITVGSGDFRIAARFGDLPMIEPRVAARALAAAVASHGVIVSESFSLKYGLESGETVQLPTAAGYRDYPICGVYRDYSNDRGTVVMDRSLYVASFGDPTISTVVVFLKKSADRERARRQLESVLGPRFNAFTVTNGEIRREVMRIFDQTFSITYALLGVAIVVAVLGVINTLSALILERMRELALLRTAGVSRGEIRAMLMIESTLLGLASTAAGAIMGTVLSLILIYVINRQSFGWTIEFHAPLRLVVFSLLLTLAASSVAGIVPARLVEHIDIAEALKEE